MEEQTVHACSKVNENKWLQTIQRSGENPGIFCTLLYCRFTWIIWHKETQTTFFSPQIQLPTHSIHLYYQLRRWKVSLPSFEILLVAPGETIKKLPSLFLVYCDTKLVKCLQDLFFDCFMCSSVGRKIQEWQLSNRQIAEIWGLWTIYRRIYSVLQKKNYSVQNVKLVQDHYRHW